MKQYITGIVVAFAGTVLTGCCEEDGPNGQPVVKPECRCNTQPPPEEPEPVPAPEPKAKKKGKVSIQITTNRE